MDLMKFHRLRSGIQVNASPCLGADLEADSRVGPVGHYVTIHLVAQRAGIPAQRTASS